MLDFFRKAAGPLKTEMNVVATCCLWIFFLHFTLYGKPKPEGESTGNNETGYEQPAGALNDPNSNRFEMQRMESDVPNEVIMEQHEFNGEEGKTPEEVQ